MTLTTLAFGLQKLKPRLLLYGVHGIGKSSFVTGYGDLAMIKARLEKYKPVFIQTEDGIRGIPAIKYPLCTSYVMFKEQLTELLQKEHDRKVLIIDTLDWLEKLINKHVCEQYGEGKVSISQFGYGRGYELVRDEVNKICGFLDRINTERDMTIVVTAHAQIKTFQNPLGEPYDRYQIKLQEKTAGVFEEWSDCNLFVNYETHVKKDSKDNHKGIGKGERAIYTSETPAFKAKNRYNLPSKIKFNFDDLVGAIETFMDSIEIDDIQY